MNTELLKSKLLEAAFNGSLTHADTSKWKKTTIGDSISFLRTGLNPRVHFVLNTSDADGYYITVRELKGLYFEPDNKTDRINNAAVHRINERSQLKVGDVLFSGTGTIGRTAIVYEEPTNWGIKEGIYALTPIREKLDSKFLTYFLHSPQAIKEFELSAYGSTISSVPMAKLRMIPIQLPPLAEQNRIVSTLEEGLAAIDAIAEAKESLSTTAEMLRSKILEAAFDGTLTGADTSKWKWLPMKRVTTLMCDGDWIEKKDQSNDGIRLVQTGNVGSGHFVDKPNSHKYISEDTFFRLNCTEVFPGDILISRLPSPVGRACELPKVDYRMITAVDCTIVRLNDSISKKLFLYYTQSPTYHNKMGESNFITGTTRARISRSNLEKIPIPLPPLAEQQRIVAKIEELFEQIDKIK